MKMGCELILVHERQIKITRLLKNDLKIQDKNCINNCINIT